MTHRSQGSKSAAHEVGKDFASLFTIAPEISWLVETEIMGTDSRKALGLLPVGGGIPVVQLARERGSCIVTGHPT